MGMLAELLFRSDRCHQMSTVLNGGGFWDPAVVDFAAGSVLALLYGCLLVQFFLPGAFAPIFQILVAGRPPKYEKSGQTRTSKSVVFFVDTNSISRKEKSLHARVFAVFAQRAAP